ncbi:MAG: arsenate reductase family protein [Bacteroides sp.]|nr:arsenate reductase family protein [Bacteroides sp.]
MKKDLFLWYPGCSTCRNAKKWLINHQISVNERHIVEENPSFEELKEWISRSGIPVKKFFSTSGVVYKELNLKEKLPVLSKEEQIRLLADNGKLIKRPLLIGEDFVLIGFKPEEWEKHFKIKPAESLPD